MIYAVGPTVGHQTGQKKCFDMAADAISATKKFSNGGAGIPKVRSLITIFSSQVTFVLEFLSQRPDAVYFTPSRSTVGLLKEAIFNIVLRTSKVPVVCHWHGGEIANFHKWPRWKLYLFRRIYEKYAHIAITDSMEVDLRRVFPDSSIWVINNFHDIDASAAAGRLGRLLKKSCCITVGFLSNVIPGKGFEDFASLSIHPDLQDSTEFFAAGQFFDPHYEKSVREVPQRVEWFDLGKCREGVWQYLSKIDILLFPSSYPSEALPLVLIEAKASGCEVIAYDHGYIRDLEKPLEIRITNNLGDMLSALRSYAEAGISPSRRQRNIELAASFSKEVYAERLRSVFSIVSTTECRDAT